MLQNIDVTPARITTSALGDVFAKRREEKRKDEQDKRTAAESEVSIEQIKTTLAAQKKKAEDAGKASKIISQGLPPQDTANALRGAGLTDQAQAYLEKAQADAEMQAKALTGRETPEVTNPGAPVQGAAIPDSLDGSSMGAAPPVQRMDPQTTGMPNPNVSVPTMGGAPITVNPQTATQGRQAAFNRFKQQAQITGDQARETAAQNAADRAQQAKDAETSRAAIAREAQAAKIAEIEATAKAKGRKLEKFGPNDDGLFDPETGNVHLQPSPKSYAPPAPDRKLLTPEEEEQQIRIAKAKQDMKKDASNPEDVKWIADQVDSDRTGQAITKLTSGDKALRNAVVSELRVRDSNLKTLTAATRQLGETAHELMPQFDKAVAAVSDPQLVAAMGPVGSRWQEFLAGRIGTSDPAFRGLSPEAIQKMNALRTTVSLLQTGTARAHVGARGSATLQAKFENLFNATKMDAATLKDTLAATKDFLKTYDEAVYGKTSGGGNSGKPQTAEEYLKGIGH